MELFNSIKEPTELLNRTVNIIERADSRMETIINSIGLGPSWKERVYCSGESEYTVYCAFFTTGEGKKDMSLKCRHSCILVRACVIVNIIFFFCLFIAELNVDEAKGDECRSRVTRQLATFFGLLGVVSTLVIAGTNAARISAILKESRKASKERKNMAEGIVALYHRTDQLKAAIDDLAKFVQDSIKKVEMELAIDELAIMVGETVNEMERNVRAARCGSCN